MIDIIYIYVYRMPLPGNIRYIVRVGALIHPRNGVQISIIYSDLGLESLDEVPASGLLYIVSFILHSTDDDDDGKGVISDSVMPRGC